MRLIDADELTRKIEKSYLTSGEKRLFIVKVKHMPTVDTTCPHCDSGYAQGYSDGYLRGKEERPQGEWQPDMDSFYCDQCGVTALEINRKWYKSNFCPNCGADMRKGGAE